MNGLLLILLIIIVLVIIAEYYENKCDKCNNKGCYHCIDDDFDDFAY